MADHSWEAGGPCRGSPNPGHAGPQADPVGPAVWTVRYVDRMGERPLHRVIYIGDDDRLVYLLRRQLAAYRMLGGLTEEVARHARLAATAGNAMRRLAAGRRRW